MAIGNGSRGWPRAHLRLRGGAWYWLSRDPLGWVGPYASAREAHDTARARGALWRQEELRR